MKDKIFFCEKGLKENCKISLDGEEHRHLSLVMRAKVGDNVTLICGDNYFYKGKILAITKNYTEILIESKEESCSEPKINLTVFQALAKGDKISLITQKISELGATDLYLFESKFSDVKRNTQNHERLKSIAISASKQCKRAKILNINRELSLREVAGMIKNYDKFYLAYENESNLNFVSELLKSDDDKNIAIMIGAEGGFSDDEIELLKSNGATIVSLGSRILRTETAAIAMTALAIQILENK